MRSNRNALYLWIIVAVLVLIGCGSGQGGTNSDVGIADVGDGDGAGIEVGVDVGGIGDADGNFEEVGEMGDVRDVEELHEVGDVEELQEVGDADSDLGDVEGEDPPMDPALGEIPVLDGAFQIVRNGLYGGSVVSLERSLADLDLVFAGTNGAGLFRSDDGGRNWEHTVIENGHIALIALHPSDPERLWVAYTPYRVGASWYHAEGHRLAVSYDGGESFEDLAEGKWDAFADISTSENTLWLVARKEHDSDYTLSRSTDDGVSWESVLFAGEEYINIQQVWAHPTDDEYLYASHSATIWRSTDGGDSFSEITPPIEPMESTGYFAAAKAAPETIWAGVFNGKPFRSTDGGTTWERVNTPHDSSIIPFGAISFGMEDPQVVWKGNDGDMHKSINGGETWTSVEKPRELLQLHHGRMALRNADEALVFSNSFEVHLTEDGGESWQLSVDGLVAVWTRSVAISPDGTRWVVGTDHGDVFVSEDQAMSFSRTRDGLDPLAITAVAIDPNDIDKIYAATGSSASSGLEFDGSYVEGALFKSVDGGQSFDRITAPGSSTADYGRAVRELRIGPGGELIAKVGSFEWLTDWYRSVDGGLSWTVFDEDLTPTPDALTDVSASGVDGPTRLVGISDDDEVLVSYDLGDSWDSKDDGGNQARAKIAMSSRVDEDILYAYRIGSFTKFSGSQWELAQVGLALFPGESMPIDVLDVGAYEGQDVLLAAGILDPNDVDLLAEGPSAIRVSRDGAATWTASMLPHIGVPTSVAVAEEAGNFGIIGFEGGRGLLITRTGGLPE